MKKIFEAVQKDRDANKLADLKIWKLSFKEKPVSLSEILTQDIQMTEHPVDDYFLFTKNLLAKSGFMFFMEVSFEVTREKLKKAGLEYALDEGSLIRHAEKVLSDEDKLDICSKTLIAVYDYVNYSKAITFCGFRSKMGIAQRVINSCIDILSATEPAVWDSEKVSFCYFTERILCEMLEEYVDISLFIVPGSLKKYKNDDFKYSKTEKFCSNDFNCLISKFRSAVNVLEVCEFDYYLEDSGVENLLKKISEELERMKNQDRLEFAINLAKCQAWRG